MTAINTTKLASRLRQLASQCSTEAQQLDRRDEARPKLTGTAIQLSYMARTVSHDESSAAHALEWIDIGINHLYDSIIARTDWSAL